MSNKSIIIKKDFLDEEKRKLKYVINNFIENEPIFFPEDYWKNIDMLEEIYDKLNSIQVAVIKNGTFIVKTFNKNTKIAILEDDWESITKITE